MPDRSGPRGGGVAGGAGGAGGVGGARVEIGALRMSIPGLDAAFGQRVAARVGARLAERCPPGLTGDVGALSLNVRAGAMTEEGLSDSIVEAVVAALGRF